MNKRGGGVPPNLKRDQIIQAKIDNRALTASQCAKMFGITKNAVIGIWQRSAHRLANADINAAIKAKHLLREYILRGFIAPERQPTGCRWIFGDQPFWPWMPHWHFCGEKRLPGAPYCAKHEAAARRPRVVEQPAEQAKALA